MQHMLVQRAVVLLRVLQSPAEVAARHLWEQGGYSSLTLRQAPAQCSATTDPLSAARSVQEAPNTGTPPQQRGAYPASSAAAGSRLVERNSGGFPLSPWPAWLAVAE